MAIAIAVADSVSRLRARLEVLLERPLTVDRLAPNLQVVTVLSAVDIVLDSAEHTIRVTRGASRHGGDGAATVEIGRALDGVDWLVHLIDASELCAMLRMPHHGDTALQAVLRASHAWLRRDPRFQALRRGLTAALPLPPEVQRIALLARPHAVAARLSTLQLEVVWRELSAFRLLARENPRLLSLAMASCLSMPREKPCFDTDPVASLKARLLQSGLSQASWRYLCRHGSRLFKPVWSLTVRDTVAWKSAVAWLKALQYASLPPPPPPALAQSFLRAFNGLSGDRLDLLKEFHAVVPAPVLRQGFEAVHRQRGYIGNEVEFLGVCAWAERQGSRLDRNLASAGWSSLVRRWCESEVESALLAAVRHKRWRCSVAAFEHEGLRIEPIEDGESLLREAWAMHNCLHEYVDRCLSGAIEYYSVRNAISHARLACIGIAHGIGRVPLLVDVRGFANAPVRASLWQLGERVARLAGVASMQA